MAEFASDSAFTAPEPIEVPVRTPEDNQRIAEEQRKNRPTAQIPFEKWWDELMELKRRRDIPLEVEEIVEDLANEIYSYLRG